MRNVAIFTMYAGELGLAIFLRPSYVKDEYAFGYAEIFGEWSRSHVDEPLDPAQAPCDFPHYVEMRRNGEDGLRCLKLRAEPDELGRWFERHPEAVDRNQIDATARLTGKTPNEVIEQMPKALVVGNLTRVMLFTLLHEAAHIRLGHLKSPRSACAAVQFEHAADLYAKRILDRVMPESEPGIYDLDLFWLIYDIGMIGATQSAGSHERLLEVRLVASAAALWARIERNRDNQALRSFLVTIGKPMPGRMEIEKTRREIASARTCLTAGRSHVRGQSGH
jgi:hypothetical protein